MGKGVQNAQMQGLVSHGSPAALGARDNPSLLSMLEGDLSTDGLARV